MGRRRVVIAGAGFGALEVAKSLQGEADVTLVAPTDQFVYLPLIHEVLSEKVLPRDVMRPLARLLPEATLVHGRARRVKGKELVTAAGDRLPFDTLVVAIGAEPEDFGVPGVRRNASTFYSVGDALCANATLKAAAVKRAGAPVRVVVVGGSFTGVEVAGEAAELLDRISVPREITLLDAGACPFPRQSERFREGVREGMKRLGLDIRGHQRVTNVRPDAVEVDGPQGCEALPSDVTFWCAGVRARCLEGLGPGVYRTLQSVERDDVYVVGDAAGFDRDLQVPKLAQTAEAQGKVVAKNILHPESPVCYEPEVKGLIVSIGHNFAVAELAGGAVVAGVVPWHLKRQLYKAKLRAA